MSGPFSSRPPHDPVPERELESADEVIDLPEDVYARIVRQVQEICQTVQAHEEHQPSARQAICRSEDGIPKAPESLEEAGISLGQMSDLILKLMYLNGTLTGFDVGRQLRLPFSAVVETLDFLKAERCLEVASGNVVGPLSYRYLLTETGRHRAREAFASCRYVGPAPVSLEQYTFQCRHQALSRAHFTPMQLQAVLNSLVIEEDLLRRLGPAVCSGQSIFLYGPPGNGKTVIARALGRLLNECGGAIYVPYAVTVDNQIISVFDPTLHRALDHARPVEDEEERTQDSPDIDLRWRKIRRPVVIAGGELSLEMLDLRYHPSSGFYTAPIQLKANGGVFLLDDFGRQLVPPQQLLNRWILPLEERTDYLSLATGKKFAVPFEQLTIFSTNLKPEDLVDAAFLRRIRHKIEIGPPGEKQFREIFRRCCSEREIKYDDWIVTRLLSTQYNPQTPPKSSDPRDLLDVVLSICRFRGERPHLSEGIVREAFEECLGGPRLSD